MALKLIPVKDRNKYRCTVCGETRSVKYLADIYDGLEPTHQAPMCNMCALALNLKVGNPVDEVVGRKTNVEVR